jgi:hypothetical protein
MRNKLKAERLRDLLYYDKASGEFYWNVARRGIVKGQLAGAIIQRGYKAICVDGVRYLSHRLAWLYVHGEWPQGELDHANGDTGDNRIENLRLATRSQNNANRNTLKATHSGVKGVSWCAKGNKNWRARIKCGCKERVLGYFATKEEAAEAYQRAASETFGEFARR